jgi:hypothetical protein
MRLSLPMADLFSSGRIIDAIIAFMVIEVVVLVMMRRKTRRGLSSYALLVNLGAGLALLLSLRVALTDLRWQLIAMWLFVALVAHLLDLRERWRPSRRNF